jgi:hypothetical protein
MKDQLEYLNDFIQSKSRNLKISPITEAEARDFGVTENSTEKELREVGYEVIDIAYENKCDEKEAWRYEH